MTTQVWAILIDHTDDNDKPIFEDRLYFVGMNEGLVAGQLKSIVENFPKVIYRQLEINCNKWFFYKPASFSDSPDSVLKIKLVNRSFNGDITTFLNFRLILLDLYDTGTLQTSIPEETIAAIREVIAKDKSVIKMFEKNVTVSFVSENGYLPARIACRIVETVTKSKCECVIARFNKTVTAGSVLMLLAIGIRNGDTVTIKCDDENCVNEICKLLQESEK